MIDTKDNLHIQMEKAVTLQNNGELDNAKSIYQKIFQQHPTQPNALHNLALIEYKQGNINDAIVLCQRCTDSNESYFQVKYCLAELYSLTGKHSEAVELYSQGYTQELKLNNPEFKLSVTLGGLVLSIIKAEKEGRPLNLHRIGCFSSSMVKSGQAQQFIEPLILFTKNNFTFSGLNEKMAENITISLSYLLGFNNTSPKKLNDIIFKDFIFPLMQKALQTRYIDLLLKLETHTYKHYVKQTETETHFHFCFKQWLPLMEDAGKSLNKFISPTSFSQDFRPKEQGSKRNIAFFFHNTSPLAHTQVVLNFLKGLNTLEDPPYNIKIYFFVGNHQPVIQKFINLGADVTLISSLLPPEDTSFVNRLLILKDIIREDNISALVWVSVATIMGFAFSLRIAPIQIWWGMKYHNLKLADIDYYLGLGAFEKYRTMYGTQWRIGHTIYSSEYTLPKPEKIEQEKSLFSQFKTILSSLSQTQKINNTAYLSTICNILKSNPTSAYLWAGNDENQFIKNFFEQQGIQDQCIFIGWVDTKLYAEVIDIYIDSFPFPCATTIIDSMLCAKPVVMMNTKESREIGIPMLINPILESDSVSEELREGVKNIFKIGKKYTEDENLLLIANNEEEYRKLTNRLINEPDFRHESGKAYQLFTQKYLQDINLMTKSYLQHFNEILNSHTHEQTT